ncbi:MAG: hypothetical protein GY729_00370, partial [Desulfobacteraceae bacterium]|nr:hypothetical protein [Desulfobacteraceae bacterium]
MSNKIKIDTKNPIIGIPVAIIIIAYFIYNWHADSSQNKEMLKVSRAILEESLEKWQAGDFYAS